MQKIHTKYAVVLLAGILLLYSSQNARADVRLPEILGDNMVLQQDTVVTFWGWADPGEEISITPGWASEGVATYADYYGTWQVRFETPEAGGPYSITIQGKNTIVLKNIMLGEVWLCSGQSNMHFYVGKQESYWSTGVINYEQEVKEANYPGIRFFTVDRMTARRPADDVTGEWKISTPETTYDFSAVAYFFGREIHEKIGVPVGLVNASWGGTPIEAWTKKKVLESDPDYAPILQRYREAVERYSEAMEEYQNGLAEWNKEVGAGKITGEDTLRPPRAPIGPGHYKGPYGVYNGMIAPLHNFAIRGVIWYQGESNADRAYQYRELFPDMIQSWRGDWNIPQMPFYFVQIAPHRSQNPEIREAQLLTFKKMSHTGMVVTTDAGDSLDIHPRNKQVVGKRLALWALAKDYGKDVVYSGPVYKSMKVEGDRIRLYFDYVDGGLVAKGNRLREFIIAGRDREFVEARAEIQGKTVVVWSDQIDRSVAVRFAWKNVPDPNLYNEAGLPASPFRTDDWPGQTMGNN